MDKSPDRMTREHTLHISVIILLITIIYLPSLDVPFIFDDLPNIVLNQNVLAENPADLINALRSPVSGNRPLAMLSFAINHMFSGLDVFGFHAFNILIHILNTILLYRILIVFPHNNSNQIPIDDDNSRFVAKCSFLAAILWAVNPVQTQAITYIVQRMTSMASLFYLAGIYVFLLRRRDSCKTIVAVPALIFLFIAGMACKEIVITLPATLFLLDFIYYPDKFRKNMLPMAIVTTLSLLLILYYLRGKFPEWSATYSNRNFTPIERVMTQWRVLWHYVSLYLLPLPQRLHLTYNIPVSKGLFSPWTTVVGLTAIVASVTLAIQIRKKTPAISWGILFFFITSAPEASFVNIELAFIHRVYLPSVFLPFLTISLIPRHLQKKSVIILIAMTTLLSYWTIVRNDEWNNVQLFWQKNVERGAMTARAKNNHATALIESGQFSEAVEEIDKGLRIASMAEDRKLLLYNRGYALFYIGDHPNALVALKKVAKEFGAFRHTILLMGLIYLNNGDIEKVKNLIQELHKHQKLQYQADILQAHIFSLEERYPEAENILIASLEHEAGRELYIIQRLQMELAQIYLKQNKVKSAYTLFLDIIDKYPQNYSVWKMIYLMLESGGDREGAKKVKLFLESKGVFHQPSSSPR